MHFETSKGTGNEIAGSHLIMLSIALRIYACRGHWLKLSEWARVKSEWGLLIFDPQKPKVSRLWYKGTDATDF